jgi:hypothetical protein
VSIKSSPFLAPVFHRAQLFAQGELDRSELFQQLSREFEPVGAAETILVAEIARHAASMQDSSAAAAAWRQFAAKTLGDLALPGIVVAEPTDGPLAEAVPCGAADRAQRQSLAHSRAFFRAVQLLLQLQGRRTANVRPLAEIPSTPFDSEQACVEYLAAWRRRNFSCRGCGNHTAHYIASRPCLECAACHAQCGLRRDTVMADSPLPLSTWFLAVWSVLREPTIKTRQLQQHLGLQRAATVRGMRDRIRGALVAEERSQRLAGLDRYIAEPEASVRMRMDQDLPQASLLATVRNSQPVQLRTFAATASPYEIPIST